MNWLTKSDDAGQAALYVNSPALQPLLADLEARMAQGQGFTVATLNMDHVVKLRQNAAFRDAYLSHSHVTADGNPIVWFSRLAGSEMELVPGSDLIDPVLERAARTGCKLALFGSTQASLDKAAQEIEHRYPGAKVVAAISPPMGFDPTGPQAKEAIETLRQSGAGLCLIALGAPKQELFAAFAAPQLPGMGFLSIGAGVDFISGAQTRAPRLVRRFAVEWLWRMVLSPRRMAGRYLSGIALLPRLLYLALKTRLSRPRTPAA
jgi:exopolysaccharide biosynthesis WecB/TagA/CpsF family protein